MAEAMTTNTKEGMKSQKRVKKTVSRFDFTVGLVVAVLAFAMYYLSPYLLLGLNWAGRAVSKPTCATPKVNVINGTYAGVYSREFKQDFFLGMPYAQVFTYQVPGSRLLLKKS